MYISAFIILISIFPCRNLNGQAKISQSVFGNGNILSSDKNSKIYGTIGQPLIGQTNVTSSMVSSGFWYNLSGIITSDEQTSDEILPQKFKLEQNYPNPFNPTTKIKYSLPNVRNAYKRPLQTTLKVYDILGREVVTIINERQQPGYYEVEFNAANLSSGIYFYKLKAGDFLLTKKMILLK